MKSATNPSVTTKATIDTVQIIKGAFDSSGNPIYPILRAVTISTAATIADVIVTATNTITVSLPLTSAVPVGKILIIKNIGTGVVTVNVSGGVQTIDGSTTYVLSVQWQSLTVISDGSNWLVI